MNGLITGLLMGLTLFNLNLKLNTLIRELYYGFKIEADCFFGVYLGAKYI